MLAAAAEAPPRLKRTTGESLGIGICGGGGGTLAGAAGGTGTGATGAGAALATGGGTIIWGATTGGGTGIAGAAPGSVIRTGGGAEGCAGAAAVGTLMVMRGGAGGAAGATVGAGFAPGGGRAISVAGANSVRGAVGTAPNCCRTSALMRGDKSTPHVGQANAIGFRTISGEASNAYFAPQSQMIFIGQGFGLSKITFVPSGSATGASADDNCVLPSVNKNTPPYL